MQSAILLPKNKRELSFDRKYSTQKEINSFSDIKKDESLDLRGTSMYSLGYIKTAKKTWADL